MQPISNNPSIPKIEDRKLFIPNTKQQFLLVSDCRLPIIISQSSDSDEKYASYNLAEELGVSFSCQTDLVLARNVALDKFKEIEKDLESRLRSLNRKIYLKPFIVISIAICLMSLMLKLSVKKTMIVFFAALTLFIDLTLPRSTTKWVFHKLNATSLSPKWNVGALLGSAVDFLNEKQAKDLRRCTLLLQRNLSFARVVICLVANEIFNNSHLQVVVEKPRLEQRESREDLTLKLIT